MKPKSRVHTTSFFSIRKTKLCGAKHYCQQQETQDQQIHSIQL